MKKTALILLFALSLFFTTDVFAQIFLEEGKVQLEVAPNETVTGSVTIHNTSREAVTLKVYWEDFTYQPPFDGSKKFFPPGTAPKSLAQHISFSPQDLILPPFGKKKVEYTLNAPAGMKGGYYGVLFFENVSDEAKDRTGLSIITRVGCLFFVESSDKTKNLELAPFTLEHNTLAGQMTNRGDVIIIIHPVYYVMDQEGLVVDRGEVSKSYLPPDQTANLSIPLSDSLPAGKLTVVIHFDLEDGDVEVRELDIQKSPDGIEILATR